MKSSVFSLAMLFPLMTLCGCGAGSSVPTEDAAKQAAQEKIKQQGHDRLKLVGFQKTDGRAVVVNGVPNYRMGFEGEVEVTEDCVGSLSELYTVPTDGVMDTTPKNLKKGARQKILGAVGFEKREEGWRSTYVQAVALGWVNGVWQGGRGRDSH